MPLLNAMIMTETSTAPAPPYPQLSAPSSPTTQPSRPTPPDTLPQSSCPLSTPSPWTTQTAPTIHTPPRSQEQYTAPANPEALQITTAPAAGLPAAMKRSTWERCIHILPQPPLSLSLSTALLLFPCAVVRGAGSTVCTRSRRDLQARGGLV